jgi:hypothetical protein
VLLVASAASLWVGSGSTDRGHAAVGVGVLAIAFAKIWLIVRYFMEVRFGPFWLRMVLDVWVAVVFSVIILLYLVSTPLRGV